MQESAIMEEVYGPVPPPQIILKTRLINSNKAANFPYSYSYCMGSACSILSSSACTFLKTHHSSSSVEAIPDIEATATMWPH